MTVTWRNNACIPPRLASVTDDTRITQVSALSWTSLSAVTFPFSHASSDLSCSFVVVVVVVVVLERE